MSEFAKVMKQYENMSAVERGLVITEKSVKILAALSTYDIDGIYPVKTQARFLFCSLFPDLTSSLRAGSTEANVRWRSAAA